MHSLPNPFAAGHFMAVVVNLCVDTHASTYCALLRAAVNLHVLAPGHSQDILGGVCCPVNNSLQYH